MTFTQFRIWNVIRVNKQKSISFHFPFSSWAIDETADSILIDAWHLQCTIELLRFVVFNDNEIQIQTNYLQIDSNLWLNVITFWNKIFELFTFKRCHNYRWMVLMPFHARQLQTNSRSGSFSEFIEHLSNHFSNMATNEAFNFLMGLMPSKVDLIST